MRKDPPTFVCDTDGCRSACMLSPAEPDLTAALTSRGWSVVNGTPPGVHSQAGCAAGKHYCPGCKAKQAAAAPSK